MIVYKTTNTVTGKIYVGKDTKNDPTYFGSGTYLKNSIKKYRIENFKKETLETCVSNEELCKREIFWIKELDTINPEVGYNILPGGEGWNKESAKIAAKIANSNRTFEERSSIQKSIWKNLTTEQRSAKAKLIWKNVSTEEQSRIATARWEEFTPEERSTIAQTRWDSFTEESKSQHSDSIKASWKDDTERKKKHADALNTAKKKLTPEQRSDIARNAVAGRWKKLREKNRE